MTQSKLLSEKIVCKEKDDDNLCQKHPNTDVRLYVNVPGQLAPETLPSMDVIPSCNDHSLQHPSQSVPTSPFIMDSSLTSQQLGKNNEKIMCPNDVDVCQEQPVQEFKPTPKPRKKKMNCTPIQGEIMHFCCIQICYKKICYVSKFVVQPLLGYNVISSSIPL